MKPIDSRFPDGDLTITVGELREWLAQFPDDAAIAGGWESQIKPINLQLSSFEIPKDIGMSEDEGNDIAPIVILDVDD